MPHIAREDGEHFVIPAYRDILSVKKGAILKKEVQQLASQHGGFIALQRKNADQYEVAFSNEAGFLLGESVWHYFKRPTDLIYCEALPGTTEAILVVVTGGSVYLDGSFPLDSIADELVIFRTQQNNFEIYVHGDVPIGEKLSADKFALEATSVKSFHVLEEPLFPTLPTYRHYRLAPVDTTLTAMGIGVIPTRKLAIIGGIVVVLGGLWFYYSTHQQEAPSFIAGVVNPYQAYLNAMATPDAGQQLLNIEKRIAQLYTAPGWQPAAVSFSTDGNILQAMMHSTGLRAHVLFAWAAANQGTVQILPEGVQVSLPTLTPLRPPPTSIIPLQQVIATVIDHVSYVMPGNAISLTDTHTHIGYNSADMTINFTGFSLSSLDLLAQQLQNLPLVLSKTDITIRDGVLAGVITLQALGS